jgi:hypothetical protein
MVIKKEVFLGGIAKDFYRIKDYYETFGKLASENECDSWAKKLSRDNFGGFSDWKILLGYTDLMELVKDKVFPREPRFEYWAPHSIQVFRHFRLWAKNYLPDSPTAKKINCRVTTEKFE